MNPSPAIAPELRRDFFDLHHSLIWGPHAQNWPEGTLLAVCNQSVDPSTGKKGFFTTTGFAPVADPDALWNLTGPPAGRGDSTYVSVAGMSPTLRDADRKGRGGKADVVALPALFADLDTAGGNHKDTNLPTVAEAEAWIEDMPIRPTLVTFTGGGFHVWVALEELLFPDTPQWGALLVAWKQWWVARAARDSRHIDAGVLADPARILRAAGTVNANQGGNTVTIITADDTARFSFGELLAAFPSPAVAAPVTVGTPKADTVQSNRALTESVPPDKQEKLGTKFARRVPASYFLVQVMSAEEHGPTGLILPRPDGTHADDENVRIFAGESGEPERILVVGERVKAEWTERGIAEPHGGTSWDMLARVLCGGDFKLAAKLLRHFQRDDGNWDELLEVLFEVSVEELREIVQPLTTSIRDAVDSKAEAIISLGDGEFVRVNGRAPGLFYTVTDKEGDTHEIRITDWCAWKAKATESWGVNSSGKSYESGESSYTVELINKRGQSFVRPGLTIVQAHNPQAVADALAAASVKLPLSAPHRRRLENMLRVLGQEDSQERTSAYTTTGWLVENGEPAVFLAPIGAVTGAGITHAFSVTAPAGSQDGALQPAQRTLGWDTIPGTPADLRRAANAIKGFLAIAPNRPDLGLALLGGGFAAPLALSTRTTIIVVGKPGVGKSQAASAAQAFYSSVGVDGRSFSMTLGKGSSKVSAEVISAWGRNILGFYDDYRYVGSPKADEAMVEVAALIVQSNYGSDAASKGTQQGGLRASRTTDGMGVMTAETMPTAEAIVSRSVGIEIMPNELDLTPRGSCGFDTFVTNYADTGLARSMQAHYIAFLARIIDSLGSLTAFRAENDKLKNAWLKDRGGRATETAAVLAVGWMRARQWATENNIEDLLPSDGVVNEILSGIADANETTTAEANPALRIIEKARDMLHGGAGYLLPHNKKEPTAAQGDYGWERIDTGYDLRWTHGNRKLLGYASADGRSIGITGEAVQHIQKLVGLTGMGKDQIRRSFESFAVPGTIAGAQAPVFLGIDGRPRVFAVSTSLLDVELPNYTTSAVQPSSTVKPDLTTPESVFIEFTTLVLHLIRAGRDLTLDGFLTQHGAAILAGYQEGSSEDQLAAVYEPAAMRWHEEAQ